MVAKKATLQLLVACSIFAYRISYSRIAYRIRASRIVFAHRISHIAYRISHIAFAWHLAHSRIAYLIRAALSAFAPPLAHLRIAYLNRAARSVFSRPIAIAYHIRAARNVLHIAYRNNRAVHGVGFLSKKSGYEAVVWPRPRDIATLDLGLAVSFPS